jgi:hypothetical protein
MFLRGYFENSGTGDTAVPAPFLVNPGLEIIFNGIFESHISRRKRAKSRILPRKITTAVSIYHAGIKHGVAPSKPALCCFNLYLSSWPLPARNADRSCRHREAALAAVAIQKLASALRLLDCFGLRPRNDGKRSRLMTPGTNRRPAQASAGPAERTAYLLQVCNFMMLGGAPSAYWFLSSLVLRAKLDR